MDPMQHCSFASLILWKTCTNFEAPIAPFAMLRIFHFQSTLYIFNMKLLFAVVVYQFP